MPKELFEIKFHGGNINPSAVKASEVAELINAFEKAIISTVKDLHPDLDTDGYAFLSFQAIKNESLGLAFAPSQAEEAYDKSYLQVVHSVRDNQYNNLPYPVLESLQIVSKFTKKHNCVCDYLYKSKVVAEITPATIIDMNTTSSITGETTIYGKVERVGGAKPRITFKEHSGYNIYFGVSEKLAKKLATKLYEDIALVGNAVWDNRTFKILDFKIENVIDLNNISLLETFKEIQGIISNNWENFEDIESAIMEDE